jgi:hypothetical protein
MPHGGELAATAAQVAVRFRGPAAESWPVQATASAVEVLAGP